MRAGQTVGEAVERKNRRHLWIAKEARTNDARYEKAQEDGMGCILIDVFVAWLAGNKDERLRRTRSIFTRKALSSEGIWVLSCQKLSSNGGGRKATTAEGMEIFAQCR